MSIYQLRLLWPNLTWSSAPPLTFWGLFNPQYRSCTRLEGIAPAGEIHLQTRLVPPISNLLLCRESTPDCRRLYHRHPLSHLSCKSDCRGASNIHSNLQKTSEHWKGTFRNQQGTFWARHRLQTRGSIRKNRNRQGCWACQLVWSLKTNEYYTHFPYLIN